jgi:hypothetical protein
MKYKVGQTVFFLKGATIKSLRIDSITKVEEINRAKTTVKVTYILEKTGFVTEYIPMTERELFESAEAILERIKEQV